MQGILDENCKCRGNIAFDESLLQCLVTICYNCDTKNTMLEIGTVVKWN